MKYACLIYVDEKQMNAAPADMVQSVGRECAEHAGELEEDGRLLACERLESVEVATTIRRQDGNLTITDGPFAETKEQLAGFYLIEADNLDEAIRIASEIPPGQFGCIEVRPVADFAVIRPGASRDGRSDAHQARHSPS